MAANSRRNAAILAFLSVIGLTQAALFYGLPPDAQQQFATPEEIESRFQAPVIDVDEVQPEVSATGKPSTNDYFVQTQIGQPVGLAINNNSELVIFHRAGRVWDQSSFNANSNVFNHGVLPNSTITVVEPKTGKLLGEYGAGLFYMPHGLSVDAEGNYWVTDVARHQVIKLDKDFKPVLELGEKMVPGSDDKHFCKPTDVAVASTGEIFVADGYCNSRVVKFNAEGKYLGSFGQMNSNQNDPKVGEFFVPHSLALIEDLNVVCVADRENQRIQCFTAGLSPKGAHQRAASTPTGTFVTKAQNIGRIMAIREKHHYLVGLTNMDPNTSDDFQLFIMDMNSGQVNTFAKGLSNAHALALSEDGDIFIAQLEPSQVLKFSVPQEQATPNVELTESELYREFPPFMQQQQ